MREPLERFLGNFMYPEAHLVPVKRAPIEGTQFRSRCTDQRIYPMPALCA